MRFRKKIGKHLFRGTIHDSDFFGLETVFHKEISDANVPGLLSARCSTVLFETNGTLIILIKIIVRELVSLLSQKHLAQMTLGK
jgi:hypothetical protein